MSAAEKFRFMLAAAANGSLHQRKVKKSLGTSNRHV